MHLNGPCKSTDVGMGAGPRRAPYAVVVVVVVVGFPTFHRLHTLPWCITCTRESCYANTRQHSAALTAWRAENESSIFFERSRGRCRGSGVYRSRRRVATSLITVHKPGVRLKHEHGKFRVSHCFIINFIQLEILSSFKFYIYSARKIPIEKNTDLQYTYSIIK